LPSPPLPCALALTALALRPCPHRPCPAPLPSPRGCVHAQAVVATCDKGKGKSKQRVVVCDPDSGQRTVLKMLLTKLGCTVVAAVASGPDMVKAVEDAGDTALDAAFVVTAMPGMSGWEALECIRRLAAPWCTALPVVAVRPPGLSAPDFDKHNAEFKARVCGDGGGGGFAASVSKPLDKHAVEAILGHVWGAAPSQAASKTAVAGEARAAPASALAGQKAAAAAGGASSSAEVVRESSVRKKAALRILVVEDHWANQKLLEAMLKQRGHDVRCSENGLEAVNLRCSPAWLGRLASPGVPCLACLRPPRCTMASRAVLTRQVPCPLQRIRRIRPHSDGLQHARARRV